MLKGLEVIKRRLGDDQRRAWDHGDRRRRVVDCSGRRRCSTVARDDHCIANRNDTGSAQKGGQQMWRPVC